MATLEIVDGNLVLSLTSAEANEFADAPIQMKVVDIHPVKQATLVAAPKPRTFATKKDRKAGKGFACTATPPCSRKDLRTASRTGVHALTQGELAQFGHAADHAPLPK